MFWTALLRLGATDVGISSVMKNAQGAVSKFGDLATNKLSQSMQASRLAEKAFSSMTEHFMKAMSNAKQFSNIGARFGMTAVEVANLAQAAEDSGVSLAVLNKGLQQIKQLGMAGVTEKLTKKQQEFSDMLGLSAADFKVLAGGGGDAMALLAQRYQALGEEAQAAALPMIFGFKGAGVMAAQLDDSLGEVKSKFSDQIVNSAEVYRTNKLVGESFKDFGDEIAVFFAALLDFISPVIGILQILWEILRVVVQAVGLVFQSIMDFGKGIVTFFIGGIAVLLDGIVKIFSGDTTVFSDIAEALWQQSLKMFKRIATRIDGFLRDLGTNIWKALKRGFTLASGEGLETPEVSQPTVRRIAAPKKTEKETEAFKKAMLDREKQIADAAWEAAEPEERKIILMLEQFKLRETIKRQEQEFIDAEKEKMKAMSAIWDISLDQYYQSEQYVKLQQEQLALQQKELKNEKDITKAIEEKAKKELEAWKSKQDRQNTFEDAQFELRRRDLEDNLEADKKKTKSKEQQNLLEAQYKKDLADLDYAAAVKAQQRTEAEWKAVRDSEASLDEKAKAEEKAIKETKKNELDLDKASRDRRKADESIIEAQDEITKKSKEHGIPVGTSLRSVGGGGGLVAGAMDITALNQKQVEEAQKGNELLAKIAENTAEGSKPPAFDSMSSKILAAGTDSRSFYERLGGGGDGSKMRATLSGNNAPTEQVSQ